MCYLDPMSGRLANQTSDNNVSDAERARKKGEPTQSCQCSSSCSSLQSSHGKGDSYYCQKDFYVQTQTLSVLLCGFHYYPNIDSTEAKHLLKPCPVGTYLIRNSSDPSYLYTISVKTKRGPTSIRILYEHGRFSLDSDKLSRSQMPKFNTMMDLMTYYIRLTCSNRSEQCRFLDKSGRKDLHIVLNKPRLNSVPSLKHISRTNINRCLPGNKATEIRESVDELRELPRPLRSYLKDYPYMY